MDTEKKKPAPPYVAYKTLKNFLERFKQSLPGRIDRGLMGSMSGAAQSQVTTALRFLGMISESGIPTDVLRRYVAGDETARKVEMCTVLADSYPFIFGGGFDLSTATASQLREQFADYTTATGETLGRCMAFLKDAARDAGLPVSPYILQGKTRTPGVKKKAAPRREEKNTGRTSTAPPAPQHPAPQPSMPALSSLLLSGLFQRLPKPGSVWLPDDRERWLQTFNNVLRLEYPES